MRNRFKVSVKYFTNTLTGESKVETPANVVRRTRDYILSEMVDKDCRELKQMRFKSQRNLHRVQAFDYALYGE